MKISKQTVYLSGAFCLAALALIGCAPLPGSSVMQATTVVYTAGASRHTAAVELPVTPPVVFEALVRLIEERPEVVVTDRNDRAFLIEVVDGSERKFTGQVTKLGAGNSLLYVWADAGSSGQSGRELAISAIELICEELGVDYEMVNY